MKPSEPERPSQPQSFTERALELLALRLSAETPEAKRAYEEQLAVLIRRQHQGPTPDGRQTGEQE